MHYVDYDDDDDDGACCEQNIIKDVKSQCNVMKQAEEKIRYAEMERCG